MTQDVDLSHLFRRAVVAVALTACASAPPQREPMALDFGRLRPSEADLWVDCERPNYRAESCYQLAVWYELGDGVPKNLERARMLAQRTCSTSNFDPSAAGDLHRWCLERSLLPAASR